MPEDKFSPADVSEAVDSLATLPYFPHESRAAVVMYVAKMCPHRRALRWLADEVVNHLDKWPALSELRGILCTRFEPADGVDQWSNLPGYRATDAEARYLTETHERLKLEGSSQGVSAGEAQALIRQLTGGMKRLAPAGGAK